MRYGEGMILAIDPGTTESAYVLLDGENIFQSGKVGNRKMQSVISTTPGISFNRLVVEMIASYGMPVGKEVFETCVWIGRFIEVARADFSLIYRKDIKVHFCGTTKAKDGNIRQAIIDRYGGSSAIGKKANPGPLYGVSGDVWAALAVGLYYQDNKEKIEQEKACQLADEIL